MKFIIDPEFPAAKIEAAAQGDAPAFAGQLAGNRRVREIIMAIQAWGFQDAGGLVGAVKSRLIAQFPDAFATKTMIERGPKDVYADYERDAILAEFPSRWPSHTRAEQEEWIEKHLWDKIYCGKDSDFLGLRTLDGDGEAFRATLNRGELQKLCQEFAAEFLAADLYKFCTKPDAIIEPLWYCPAILEILTQAVDRAVAQSVNSIACTSVSRQIEDRLQYALEKKAFIRIDGNSRVGKTETIRAWCNGRPGLVRLVKTHCMNSKTDFFLSIADAIGVPCNYKSSERDLRMKIEFILRHTGLMLVMDEAHFIFAGGTAYSVNSYRVDWIRTCLVDRQTPLVLVTTPQQFDAGMARLKKATAWNTDQWDGRLKGHTVLKDKLTLEDLLAVVRHKAPDFSPAFQQNIADAAVLSPNSFPAVQSIVDNARWIAERAGRALPTESELFRAIDLAVPNAVAPAQEPESRPAPAVAPTARRQSVAIKRSRAAAPSRSITPAPTLEAPARATTPVLTTA